MGAVEVVVVGMRIVSEDVVTGQEHGAAKVRRLSIRTEVLVGHAGVEHRDRHRRVALLDVPHALRADRFQVPLKVVKTVIGSEVRVDHAVLLGVLDLGHGLKAAHKDGRVHPGHGLDHIPTSKGAPRGARAACIAKAALGGAVIDRVLELDDDARRIVHARGPRGQKGECRGVGHADAIVGLHGRAGRLENAQAAEGQEESEDCVRSRGHEPTSIGRGADPSGRRPCASRVS